MKPRVRGSLVWSLTSIAVVQAVLLVCVFVGVGVIKHGGQSPPPHDLGAGGPHASPPGDAPPPADPPPAPPPHEHRARRLSPIARLVTPDNTVFLGGLVILGIGAVLTGRWIVRPVRDLSRVVRAFGEGDLRARSDVGRSDEIGELARAFDEMAGRVQALLVAEKELLANISHELRTPLARIRVALDIATEAGNAGSASPLAGIGGDLEELEKIIDDVMTTARLDIARGTSAPSRFELHVAEIQPASLGQYAAERFRARHPSRALELSLDVMLPAVRVDQTLFRRAIDNLLENAHKYSPDAASAVTLKVGRATGARAVEFIVEDRGVGIGDDDLPHLFTPFFRADRSRTRGTGGVGLGLLLTKRIVDAHGGSIAVRSKLGAGTTVHVAVPIEARG
jgi:signal transduction histidine kinase